MSSEERYCHFELMPAQFEKVISSFLTRFAYEKLAVSTAWHIPPGFKVLKVNLCTAIYDIGSYVLI
jgi:hypothetical protein